MPDPDLKMSLSGAFGVKQGRLERMIRLLEPLLTLQERATVLVELGGLVSVSPAALALPTAALKRAVDLDLFAPGSVMNLPLSPPVKNYLEA